MERDHRKIGQQLELFMFSDLSPGSPIWLDRGNTVLNLLADAMRQMNRENGYIEVKTPVLWKTDLYATSGHLDHYRENMFLVQSEDTEYALKPMNCPGHMVIFAAGKYSYRELPLRMSDFGVLHRNESSGSLGGLTRCRAFCQDDAHCFVKPEDVLPEITSIIRMIRKLYKAFNFELKAALSTRPKSFMGEESVWQKAEQDLKDALASEQQLYDINEGDGAFYGPKIDFTVTDSLGRSWQTATIQLDFQLPKRFGLKYVGADNKDHEPIVIHRALCGSFERFIGILLEHLDGKLPDWLAPVQVAILPIADRHISHCNDLATSLNNQGVRVEVYSQAATLNQKVLISQTYKIPYALVVGDKEIESHKVAVRTLDGQNNSMFFSDFFTNITHVERPF